MSYSQPETTTSRSASVARAMTALAVALSHRRQARSTARPTSPAPSSRTRPAFIPTRSRSRGSRPALCSRRLSYSVSSQRPTMRVGGTSGRRAARMPSPRSSWWIWPGSTPIEA
ncbi:hypothetical protein K701_07930 [Streptomyces fradiae ATCC 10745 = DSM 40063]|uniref:Uncharacterized protein n=1 Tax=Streptomyces fradiae ATCC 10745 = DSM 40063 TaxID=1319510 RepID=A0ABQ6XXL5_STRFR|nr:hypothetical protein K701_07930 [Streptomyces fradiae ATCC 10745 = DSM 40063]